MWWTEIARLLRPGGTYLAQHVGPESARELYEFFLGPRGAGQHPRDPDPEGAEAEAAGLRIITLRVEWLRMEFFDIAAVVYFLRKVIWTVPDFTVEPYRERLHDLHEQIQRDGRSSLTPHASSSKPTQPRNPSDGPPSVSMDDRL